MIKPFIAGLALFSSLAAVRPACAAAPVIGNWHVVGQIDGKPFDTECHFTPAASGFGGVCIDAASGKKHVVSAGSASGSAVRWRYDARYMMFSFTVSYAGTLTGNAMKGTISAAGHKGDFTATRG